MKVAQRLSTQSTHFFASLAARVAAMQAAGVDVIRLDEGSPDLPPPAHILAALACSAASPANHSYTGHRATTELRQAWASMYARQYAVQLDPDREVLPLMGSKEGIFHLLLALVEPGDIVLVPNPGYITYTRGSLFAGASTFDMPITQEGDYLPDLQAIPGEVLPRARILWLNYPNNPTAATATEEFFSEVVAFAQQHQLIVCHDAAYSQVTFDGKPAPSLLAVPGATEVGVEFNTLSKSHNMAGWRVGAALGNAQVLSALFTLKTNTDSGHFRPILDAATAAMTADQDWIPVRNEIYRQRRDAVIAGLNTIGLKPQVPSASLYVWSPIPPGWSAGAFTTAVLEEAHLSLTPGTVFGSGGEGYMRIALTAPEGRIQLGMARLAQAMDQIERRRPGL